MVAYTPQQGLSYPIIADRPCDVTTTAWLFGQQLDAKSAGLDADMARAGSNNFVKISASNLALTSASPSATTVEWNRGTPTDLTVYDGLRLGLGIWLVGGWAKFTPHSAGGDAEIVLQEMHAWTRDFGSDPGIFGSQYISGATIVEASTSDTRIPFVFNSFGLAWVYLTQWAFQVGDI